MPATTKSMAARATTRSMAAMVPMTSMAIPVTMCRRAAPAPTTHYFGDGTGAEFGDDEVTDLSFGDGDEVEVDAP